MYGYEVALYISSAFGGINGLRAVYKVDGDWHYISEPTFYDSDVDTKSKADSKIAEMLSIINTAAYDELNVILAKWLAKKK